MLIVGSVYSLRLDVLCDRTKRCSWRSRVDRVTFKFTDERDFKFLKGLSAHGQKKVLKQRSLLKRLTKYSFKKKKKVGKRYS